MYKQTTYDEGRFPIKVFRIDRYREREEKGMGDTTRWMYKFALCNISSRSFIPVHSPLDKTPYLRRWINDIQGLNAAYALKYLPPASFLRDIKRRQNVDHICCGKTQAYISPGAFLQKQWVPFGLIFLNQNMGMMYYTCVTQWKQMVVFWKELYNKLGQRGISLIISVSCN